jgi:hypothetical protein
MTRSGWVSGRLPNSLFGKLPYPNQLMNAENCKLIQDLLMPVCETDDGTCDMWTYLLARKGEKK